MSRQYAVLLGVLAFFVQQARCLFHGGDFAANVLNGIAMAAAFAVIGAFVGGTAEWMLGDTLRQELQLSMSEQKAKK